MGIVNQHLAQKMVDYIVRVVNQNVNIMDEHGVIIASADKGRIGQTHRKAIEAIQKERMEVVDIEEDGMRKGVNMPIRYHDQICGVVGISGDVEELKQIIDLVRCSIELLIEQDAMMNLQQIRKQLREQFLYEWMYRPTPCSFSFISRGENCGVSIKTPRRVALIRLQKSIPENLLENHFENNGMDNHCIRLSTTLHILIMNTQQTKEAQFKNIFRLAPTARVSVGEAREIIHSSLLEAQAAMRIGESLYPGETLFEYKYFRYIDLLVRAKSMPDISGKPRETTPWIQPENTALIDTLLAYFRNNGRPNQTANELHIHRNTLNYRLDQIYQVSGFDPRKYLDLYSLICDYILFEMNESVENESVRSGK